MIKMKRLCARRRKQNSVEMSLLTTEDHQYSVRMTRDS